MNEAGQWWYERGGRQAGPVTLAALRDLAAQGELTRASLVWTEGMPAWTRAETISDLTFPTAPPPLPDGAPLPTTAAPPPRPASPPRLGVDAPTPPYQTPSSSSFPSSAAPLPPPAGSAAALVAEPGEVNVGTTILLSIVTLGVYGCIKFFQTGQAYERLAGRETKFTLYFWLFVGFVAGGVLIGMVTGLPLGLVGLVFQFLTLNEALAARRDAMERWGLSPQVASDTTHWVLLGFGTFLSWILVGLILLVVQAVKWFEDWNAIRAAAAARAP